MLFTNATLVTLNDDWDVVHGALRIEGPHITGLGRLEPPKPGETVIDLQGRVVLPGFVQAHLHLCQTLFRNAAEHLELLDWLKQRIWPLEAAHTPESLYQTARLGLVELLRGGVTSILDMGTVHHTDAIFEAARESGIRAFIGKAMMDQGDDVPAGLRETTESSLRVSCDLFERWDGQEHGRLRYTFAPRFVPSCSRPLLQELTRLASDRGIRIHTHASENRGEIALVRELTGLDNIAYLDTLGLTGTHVGLAHCVWVTPDELSILARTQTNVLHCPGSNLKLASGIAPIPEMLRRGIPVGLGSDGAPCNNRLDMFEEMRLAGLIQRPEHGPRVMEARDVVKMATRGGAAAIGLSDQIGVLEPGRLADIIVLDLDGPETSPGGDLYARIVYAADRGCVRDVVIHGRPIVRDGQLLTLNASEVVQEARREGRSLFARAGLEGLWS